MVVMIEKIVISCCLEMTSEAIGRYDGGRNAWIDEMFYIMLHLKTSEETFFRWEEHDGERVDKFH
eukprot:135245-Hanusia_phi.AAC.3